METNRIDNCLDDETMGDFRLWPRAILGQNALAISVVILWVVAGALINLFLVQMATAQYRSWIVVCSYSLLTGLLLFIACVAGFMGRTWLNGMALGVVCVWVLLGSFGTAVPKQQILSGLCFAPLCVVSMCCYPLLCRSYRGWHLAAAVAPIERPKQLGIEDLFWLVAIVSAALMLAWAPIGIQERPWQHFESGTLLNFAAMALVFFCSAGFFATISVGIVLGTSGRQSVVVAIAAFAILTAVVGGVLILLFALAVSRSAALVTTIAVAVASTVFLLGLLALRSCGMILARNSTANRSATGGRNRKDLSTNRDQRRDRLLATSFVTIGVIASWWVGSVDARRRASQQAVVHLEKLARRLGGSVHAGADHEIRLVTLGERATGMDLRQFAACEAVHTLNLSGIAQVQDALPILGEFPHLCDLSLDRTGITDIGLARLPRKGNFIRLSLADTRIDGSGFASWPSEKQWMSIDLSRSAFQPQNLKLLDRFTLYQLGLRDIEVSDEHLFKLSSAKTVRVLDLRDTGVTGRRLQRYAALNRLYLDRTKATDHSLGRLPPKVMCLTLRQTGISDQGVAKLASHPNLRALSLADTSITTVGLSSLPTNLTQLNLSGLTLADKDIAVLARFPYLRQLSLARTRITDNSLPQLAKMNLEKLDVRKTLVTSTGIAKHNWQPRSVLTAPAQFTASECISIEASIEVVPFNEKNTDMFGIIPTM